MNVRIVYCLFLLIPFLSVAQENELEFKSDSNMIQISGVAISEATLDPLPYTTIFNKTERKGVIADYFGFFSMVAFPGDTLYFSFYGHKTEPYIIPDTLTEKRYSIIHMLREDTLNIPEVTVYPWPSREDFARAFIELEPYDDALRRAQRQLSGESLAFIAAKLDTDASLSYGASFNARSTKLYTNGQLPVNNLLNPYSWAKLIKEWKEGNLSRQ